MKKRLFFGAVLVLLVATLLAAPALAGTRVIVNDTLSANDTIYPARFVSYPNRFRIHGTSLMPDPPTLLFYRDAVEVGAMETVWDVAEQTEGTLEVWVPAASAEGEHTWQIVIADDSGLSIWVDWVEVDDVYGDPSYELSLLEQIVANTTTTPTKTQATLTSGNEWGLNREFSYGDITSGIALAGLAIIQFVRLIMHVVR